MTDATSAPRPGGDTAAPRTIVVMPAYNAAATLRATWQLIPTDTVDEVVLVDDASADETLMVAHELGIRTIPHPHNVGYGGNQKTCYLEALRRGADIVVMLHPDGQYDPQVIPSLIAPIAAGEADMVLGSRLAAKGAASATGMPWWKYVANRALTAVENAVLRESFSELHTGYRAYSRSFLEKVPFLRNSNDFVFDTQMIIQGVHFGMRLVEVPVSTRYHKLASSVDLRTSVVYGLKTLVAVGLYALRHVARPRFLQPPRE